MIENNELTDGLIITKQFRTANDFSLYIETRVVENRTGYMESVIQYCNEAGIELEGISKLVSSSLKEKIRVEAEEANLLKPRGGKGKLPL